MEIDSYLISFAISEYLTGQHDDRFELQNVCWRIFQEMIELSARDGVHKTGDNLCNFNSRDWWKFKKLIASEIMECKITINKWKKLSSISIHLYSHHK